MIDIKLSDLPTRLLQDRLVDRSRRTITAVYKVVDGKAVLTPVKVGPSNLSDTIISKGLVLEEKVVIGPYKSLEKLNDGQRVKVEEISVDLSIRNEIAEEEVDDVPTRSDSTKKVTNEFRDSA